MDIQPITVNGVAVYVIESKQQWINSFPGALPEFPMSEKYLWIDKNGNITTTGEDFMKAEDTAAYPVTIYWLQRTSHLDKPDYVQKIKNLFWKK